MKQHVVWSVEGLIRTENEAEFKSVMADMVTATTHDDGVLAYEWALTEDGKHLHVYERYENAEAAVNHLTTWSKNAARFIDVVDIQKIVVYSEMPPTLKAAFAGANVVFMRPIGGFANF